MSENVDRRIQLREGIHKLVLQAAEARFMSPAAFVTSLLVREFLTTGEIAVGKALNQPEAPEQPTAPAAPVELTPKQRFIAHNKAIFTPDDLPSMHRQLSQIKAYLAQLSEDPNADEDKWDLLLQQQGWLKELIAEHQETA